MGRSERGDGGREARFAKGDVVAARYRIDGELGRGGMGEVYAAEHLVLRKPIALKVLRARGAHASRGGRQHGRLLREARAATRIVSEHAVRVLDAGELDDGSPYLVMERLRGLDVADALATHGRLDPKTAIAIVAQACHAVGEAHAAGIVHRDLKPSNLFLVRREGLPPIVKVLDFGIAKIVEGDDGAATVTGAVMGSPRYMSPEQIRDPREVTARSDVWSLGVTLYELVTGRPPFESPFVSALCAIIVNDAPAIAFAADIDVPAGLEEVIVRCLEKSPAARFADAHELRAALLAIAGDAEIAIGVEEGEAFPASTPPAPSATDSASDDASPSVTLLDTHATEDTAPPTAGRTSATNARPRGRTMATAAAAIAVGLAVAGLVAFRAPTNAATSASAAEASTPTLEAASAPTPARTDPAPTRPVPADAETAALPPSQQPEARPAPAPAAPTASAIQVGEPAAPRPAPRRGPTNGSGPPASSAPPAGPPSAAPPVEVTERAVLRDRR